MKCAVITWLHNRMTQLLLIGLLLLIPTAGVVSLLKSPLRLTDEPPVAASSITTIQPHEATKQVALASTHGTPDALAVSQSDTHNGDRAHTTEVKYHARTATTENHAHNAHSVDVELNAHSMHDAHSANHVNDAHASHEGHHAPREPFPLVDMHFEAGEAVLAAEKGKPELGLIETLLYRASQSPINVIATVIFFLAIVHTFFAGSIMKLAHRAENDYELKLKQQQPRYRFSRKPVSLKATVLHFLGEVEAIFGIWLIPLFLAITLLKGWDDTTYYVDNCNYVEPIFVVVIMAIASSLPVIRFSEAVLGKVAALGKHSPAAWWLSILTIAPLLGSFITEPAAMTIAAMLLGHQFYALNPSPRFKYATLGLLFVNVSVGGTLAHFAAPPVLMVATKWNWDIVYMSTQFGWRAMTGIVVANAVYFCYFRKDFKALKERRALMERDAVKEAEDAAATPLWIIIVHLSFLAWTVFTLHHPALFILGFLLFIGFTMGTAQYQDDFKLKGPLLVGFFLAGLVTHGGLQGWWISPVLSSLTELPLFIGSTVLTAFNDNAAITYLASQVSSFDPHLALDKEQMARLQYAVVAGAVTGGGLTVIANAPNPAGQSILSRYFENGVAPLKLLLGALIPTLIMSVCFIVLPH